MALFPPSVTVTLVFVSPAGWSPMVTVGALIPNPVSAIWLMARDPVPLIVMDVAAPRMALLVVVLGAFAVIVFSPESVTLRSPLW